MPDSEARWFKIISFVVTGIIAGLLLADIIYFNELRRGATLSSGEINSMLVITSILFVITILMFIWSLIRLFIHKDTRQSWSDSVQSKTSKWVNSTNGGYTQQDMVNAYNKASNYYGGLTTSSSLAPAAPGQEAIAADL